MAHTDPLVNRIESFDKRTLKTVREAIDGALAAAFADSEINAQCANISYDEYSCTVKVKLTVGDENAKEKDAWKREAHYFGIDADALGKTLMHQGQEWTIIGWRSRARKYPVLVQRGDDKLCLTTDEVLCTYPAK